MGDFNSDDHCIYNCGQESLRRNGVALMVTIESEMQYLGAISKMTGWSLLVSKAKPFNITVIQVYAPTSKAEEVEVEQFYEDLQDLLELTPKTDIIFILGDWNAKVGSQEIPGVTDKFGFGVQNYAGQRLTVLPRESTRHSTHPLPITQDDSTHGHHQMVNTKIGLIMLFVAEDGETLYS